MKWRVRLKQCESNKLYYNIYLYRLEIYNQLSTIFREKRLNVARESLDNLQAQHDIKSDLTVTWGRRLSPIRIQDFIDAKKLYNAFSNYNDFKLRVERNYLNIYCNDLGWLMYVSSLLDKESVRSLYKPNIKDIKLLDANTIIVDKDNGYQFRVTLGNKNTGSSFAAWARKNKKLVKVGYRCLEEMEGNGYVNNMYFYARDEKTLQLIALLTDNVRRIDKLVVKSTIDK